MSARLNAHTNPVAGNVVKALLGAGKAINGSSLPAVVRHLVEIRASQINGCGYCVDMHTKDAAHEGESDARLHLLLRGFADSCARWGRNPHACAGLWRHQRAGSTVSAIGRTKGCR
ncbi:carboxymuconolactone decarboxylase family protein [Actinoplanes oblitus]|uniref:Carboxymuconolactone decarboxylase family protein n=1 Tax=Actinoplanes oblitus TaxID=3040509 RepID=A0ABY8WNJ9_9ACTN|nr:carboxymuconolactone decarboxylase family protein [Actinoplanes oblitus]WIM99441.1 carboxymuconolactone decarboxylase family protein [Actinoplanes oblitus]